MDFKDKLLLKVLKFIDVKLGNVQGSVVVLNAHDPYFTDEDRQFMFNTLCRLDDEFGAIKVPDSGHEDSYKITTDQKEITSLINWLTRKEKNTDDNKIINIATDTQAYTYKNLSINLSSATLTYNGVEIPISPQNKPIKYLLILIQNQGKVVSHKDIAQVLKIKDYDQSSDLNNYARDVQMVKRDLKKELIALGEEKAEQVRDMVKMVKAIGSILR